MQWPVTVTYIRIRVISNITPYISFRTSLINVFIMVIKKEVVSNLFKAFYGLPTAVSHGPLVLHAYSRILLVQTGGKVKYSKSVIRTIAHTSHNYAQTTGIATSGSQVLA